MNCEIITLSNNICFKPSSVFSVFSESFENIILVVTCTNKKDIFSLKNITFKNYIYV